MSKHYIDDVVEVRSYLCLFLGKREVIRTLMKDRCTTEQKRAKKLCTARLKVTWELSTVYVTLEALLFVTGMTDSSQIKG